MFDPEELVPERVRPLRRVEYDKLVDAGFFEDERLELLCGVLVEMSPQGGPHAGITARIHNYLVRRLPETFEVRSHSPFAADEYSEPEPDVQVVPRGSVDDHPSRALLLVEVAQSSLRKDRRIKAKIYAAAGIPEYWIVDVIGEVVEVYSRPDTGAYTKVERIARGGVLRPVALPDVTVPVDEILALR